VLMCGLPLSCVGLFFLGFWMGKTEVRGFLGGVDASLDKLTATINARDSAAIAARSKAAGGGGEKAAVTIVQAEPARFRVRSNEQDVIDL